MDTDAPVAPLRSPSPAAERMRLFRRRRRNGMLCVRVQLSVADIDALIAKGYLNSKKREDMDALAQAADGFISDAPGGLADMTMGSSAE